MSVSNTQFQCLVPQNGPLPIPMTNDYLFRALLQQNNNVLKGLISSLLHLHDTEISSVAITNPIELGRSTDEKTFILDISMVLNDSALINLEMQVINFHDWTDRSLSYLCRKFDQLKKGEPYRNLKPVIQISLLNFTLFPEHPEFYATYKLLNVKSHMLYSDKLQACQISGERGITRSSTTNFYNYCTSDRSTKSTSGNLMPSSSMNISI